MTLGQRIAQKRKERGLSQEALGAELGVSRQSIYKWESDAALPEIDKLVTLSRLFGVSVGALLGVEEPSAPDSAAGADRAELTEIQLQLVEEIVGRYLAAQPTPKKRRRWPLVLAGLALLAGLSNLFQRFDMLQLQNESLQNDISRVERSVDQQIGGISDRVEAILKAQNSLTADYGVEIQSASLAHNQVTFSAYAVPKTYRDGMTAEFSAVCGDGQTVPAVTTLQEGERFLADVTAPMTDAITVSVVFTYPDGAQQTQLLQEFSDLYTASLPAASLMTYSYGDLLDLEAESGGRLTLPELYVTTKPEISSYAVNAAVGRSQMADCRVGLFQNRRLLVWLEPCPQPETFHGEFSGQSFFRLSAGTQVTLADQTDELCFAALVTDEYGRQAVHSDIPYILQNGALAWPSAPDLSDHAADRWAFE